VIVDLVVLKDGYLKLKAEKSSPLIGMIVSDLIREYLLSNGISFTMETVFSHPDKLELIRKAIAKGYKVYLYFVSTEDPLINVKRVAAGGHDVPHNKIVERYERTMNNLYEAVKLSYRAYIFDNSGKTTIKIAEKDKDGTVYIEESVPEWLLKYLRIS
jgi:predicted ABC-type ATPase